MKRSGVLFGYFFSLIFLCCFFFLTVVILLLMLQVYRERVLSVAVNCARQAAKDKVKKFIHFSTAQVYDCSKVRGQARLALAP